MGARGGGGGGGGGGGRRSNVARVPVPVRAAFSRGPPMSFSPLLSRFLLLPPFAISSPLVAVPPCRSRCRRSFRISSCGTEVFLSFIPLLSRSLQPISSSRSPPLSFPLPAPAEETGHQPACFVRRHPLRLKRVDPRDIFFTRVSSEFERFLTFFSLQRKFDRKTRYVRERSLVFYNFPFSSSIRRRRRIYIWYERERERENGSTVRGTG